MSKDMKYLVGKIIRIDRGGPESRIGMLMEANDDHLVLLTEDDGVVYYKSHHIKSITDNVKEQMQFNIEVPKGFEYKNADTFQSILDSLKFQWVKINRGGPEKLEGVLSDVNKDFVSLINKEEIVRLSMFHIKNISYGLKIEKPEEQKSDNENNQRNQSNQNKQSKQSSSREKSYESEKQQSRQRVVKSSSVIQEETTATNTQPEVPMNQTNDGEANLTELLTSMERFLKGISRTNQNN